MNAVEAVLGALESEGFKGTVIPVGRLRQLQGDLEGPHSRGLLDEELYRRYLADFHFGRPATLPDAASIILAAMPQPKVCVRFHVGGRVYPAVIPPTYSYDTDDSACAALTKALDEHGYTVLRAAVPVKALAVHTGLARYGRNNVTYIDGWGSFFRLRAFFSDLPCSEETWYDFAFMDECEHCRACINGCPTAAIDEDRFLLRAERCLTYMNENPGDFPGWVDPSWHNSLIGCMICQEVCPLNRTHRDWAIPGPEFSEDETSALIGGLPADRLSAVTIRKLARLGMSDAPEVLGRNLSLLARTSA